MRRRISIWTVIIVCLHLLFFASSGWSDVPAPPVNQNIGMVDTAIGDLTEADCRVCHSNGVPDRHHILYDQPIPTDTLVPYPDSDGDGNPDTSYACLNCHNQNFVIVRDCIVCHTSSPHHSESSPATGSNCSSCHGSLVDDIDDGHYIPSYSPSLVTPTRSLGNGLPLNSREKGAGACNYCHDNDDLPTPFILTNQELHHSASEDCDLCHDFDLPFEQQIRICEGCHGPDSLHNIQADSPNTNNIGSIVIGGENAGYGHVGRDAGPGDSDCWGCHGFAAAALAPLSGPLVPTIHKSHRSVVTAGKDTLIVLTGSSFTNSAGQAKFESDGLLTAPDGSSVTLKPGAINEEILAVTISSKAAPGNYNLQAVKTDYSGKSVASNPVVITIVPEVVIANVTSDKIVTIEGKGFGGYIDGSLTSVTGEIKTGDGATTMTMEATIVSWSDTTIKADFSTSPVEVTVKSVFGTCTSKVGE